MRLALIVAFSIVSSTPRSETAAEERLELTLAGKVCLGDAEGFELVTTPDVAKRCIEPVPDARLIFTRGGDLVRVGMSSGEGDAGARG